MFNLPVIWKEIFGDIPLVIAQIIAFLGLFVCIINIMIIYLALTICRILVNCDCHWFTSLDKQIVTKTIFLLSIIVVIVIRVIIYLIRNSGYVGFVLYLSSIKGKQAVRWKYPLLTLVPIVSELLISFLLELYISIKLKKLPWTSLKSVTLGHIFMGMIPILIATRNKDNVKIFPIKSSMLILALQTLYALKYRTHIIQLLRRLCCNLTVNSIAPDQQDLELNDIGIFVGPPRALTGNFVASKFCGEEINITDTPNLVQEVINNTHGSNFTEKIISNTGELNIVGQTSVREVIDNQGDPNMVEEIIPNADEPNIDAEVINNQGTIAIISNIVDIENVYLDFGGVYIGTPKQRSNVRGGPFRKH